VNLRMTSIFKIIGLILLTINLSFAQKDRYVFYFKDKSGTTFNLNEPLKFLSNAALERRVRNSIPLDQSDLPVSSNYIQQIRSAGGKVLFTTKWMNAALTEVDTATLKTISKLSFVTRYEKVAPGQLPVGQSEGIKSNENQRKTQETLVQLSMLGIDVMHSDQLRGEGVTIAIMDSGFPAVNSAAGFNHLVSNNRLKDSYNFVFNRKDVYGYDSHGADVLSILAAKSGESFTGAAPEANYLLYVTEHVPTEFRVEEYNWLFAAERADSAGADIINTSLGYSRFDDPSMNYTYQQMDGKTAVISRAATLAASKGILVVVSAGNEGGSSWKYITAPADSPEVIAAGSVDFKKSISSFSSTGPTVDGRIKPDLMAMGSSTALLFQGTTVASGSGTSFSAPLVAGLAAGVLQSRADKSLAGLKGVLIKSGDRYGNPDNQYGYGIPDYLKMRTITSIKKEIGSALYPNPARSASQVVWRTGQHMAESLQLVTSTGSLMKINGQWSQEKKEWLMDVRLLSPGLYLLLSRQGNSMVRAKLLIQQDH